MKQGIKIVNTIASVLLYSIIPLVGFFLFTSKFPVIKSIRSYVVMSGSMEPKIPVGSVIIVKNTSAPATPVVSPLSTGTQKELPLYKAGDVISFHRNGTIVTHRIVSADTTGAAVAYRTKGDANDSVDSEVVPQDQIIGKTIKNVPSIGKLIVFLKTPLGFLLCILIPGFSYIAMELKNMFTEIQKSVEEKYKSQVNIV